MRKILICTLALLSALVVAPAAATPRPESSDPGLSVLSYNIHHGVGVDGALDLDRVAEVIRDSGADVVALQEVDRHWSARSGHADQAAVLAEKLGMHHVFGANLDRAPARPGQPRRQYGTAVLSRFPITASGNTALPNLGGEQRGLLHARLRAHGEAVSVYSTHLQHDNAAERAAQTEAIVDHVGSATEPVIVAGDLNARPNSSEMEPIRHSFTDTFATAGAGSGHTYPANDPSARIDYVVTNDHVRTRSAEVLASEASDHLPVRTEVTLTAPYAPVTSLDRAHAHNDYEHRRPLFDALHHGFTSVEADIWLQDGQLRVAHEADETTAGRTLKKLYLEPLSTIVRANDGRVYPDRAAPVQLLVDLKSDARKTFTALNKMLQQYRDMLTRYGPDSTKHGAVEVVVSGNRPRELMASESVRWAGYDGRLSDLDGDESAHFMPLISDNWTENFTWRGIGPMPPTERKRLERIVGTAHADDKRVRFWATPDRSGKPRENVWSVLVESGVDHINTDDLAGLRDFLLSSDA